ncbi:hypothetical protein E1B28_008372 [Marasmius oreades]|uniref:Uncharacterized protein n=1 Tax=Marasmius oreades TaxID=181124 RepID=A0A9P7USC0_9AGAR|nr:uncharacterized protein E1B28_008372 [Marasmius oreades]KAG7091985.1 hypothetical protein E1B28_008372 [Marasmius oreades]
MSMWPFTYAWPRPFDGRAPPVPPNANPRQWLAGNWIPNPAFNWHQPFNQARNTWVPAQGGGQWPQQQQNAQTFNPYKRVPKPPSAEYLASKLSDNPLGLTNMVSREELYGPGVDGVPPETPWVWTTQDLQDEDEDGQPGSTTTSLRRNPSSQSRHGSTPNTSMTHSQTTGQSQPSRHSSEPPLTSSSDSPNVNGPLGRPRNQMGGAGSSIASAQAQTAPLTASANPPNPLGVVDDVRELRPTFSPRIVRTPEHYRTGSTLSRSNSLASVANEPLSSAVERMSTNDGTPSRRSSSSRIPEHYRMGSSTLVRNNSLSSEANEPPSSAMERMSTDDGTPSRRPSFSRQSSLSSTETSSSDTSTVSMSGVETLSDEPAGILSPLMLDTPHLPPTKPLGRHHTAPSIGGGPLTSIPEDRLGRAPPIRQASDMSTSASSHLSATQSTQFAGYSSGPGNASYTGQTQNQNQFEVYASSTSNSSKSPVPSRRSSSSSSAANMNTSSTHSNLHPSSSGSSQSHSALRTTSASQSTGYFAGGSYSYPNTQQSQTRLSQPSASDSHTQASHRSASVGGDGYAVGSGASGHGQNYQYHPSSYGSGASSASSAAQVVNVPAPAQNHHTNYSHSQNYHPQSTYTGGASTSHNLGAGSRVSPSGAAGGSYLGENSNSSSPSKSPSGGVGVYGVTSSSPYSQNYPPPSGNTPYTGQAPVSSPNSVGQAWVSPRSSNSGQSSHSRSRTHSGSGDANHPSSSASTSSSHAHPTSQSQSQIYPSSVSSRGVTPASSTKSSPSHGQSQSYQAASASAYGYSSASRQSSTSTPSSYSSASNSGAGYVYDRDRLVAPGSSGSGEVTTVHSTTSAGSPNKSPVKYSSASASAASAAHVHDRHTSSTTPTPPSMLIHSQASGTSASTAASTRAGGPRGSNPYDWRSSYSTPVPPYDRSGTSSTSSTSTVRNDRANPPESLNLSSSPTKDSRHRSRSRGSAPQISPSSSTSSGYDSRQRSRHASPNPPLDHVSANPNPLPAPPTAVPMNYEALANGPQWGMSSGSSQYHNQYTTYTTSPSSGSASASGSSGSERYLVTTPSTSNSGSSSLVSTPASISGSPMPGMVSTYGTMSTSASAAAAVNEMRRLSVSPHHAGQGNINTKPQANNNANSTSHSQINNPSSTTHRSSNPMHQQVRKGFWNRRGDHLTQSGHIVYAPVNRAYPHDLRTYPTEDYRNESGMIASFVPNRPELPESLPMRGQPPSRPYESFIIFADV